MNKIYIVLLFDEDGQSIMDCFSTRELATEFVKKEKDYYNHASFSIDEFIIRGETNDKNKRS